MKIPERQAELDALTRKYLADPKPEPNGHAKHRPLEASDEEILALCRKARNAAKFEALYDAADMTAYGDDASRADQALAGILAFYTQDPAQLERLFSASALGRRSKWRRTDYRQRTINRALDSLTETYTPRRDGSRSRSRSLGDLGMSNEPEPKLQAFSFTGREKPGPRTAVVDNHVWVGHATSWFGEGGVAKSLLAMHLGLTVAEVSQSYWMAFAVKTVPVLYLDFELDADEQHRRALDLAAGMGLKAIPEDFYYLSVAMMPPVQAFMVAAEECRRLGIGLVIVDSVGFALGGDAESAKDVLDFYRVCIQPLKDAGASPLLIDHQAKIIKGEKYSDKQAFGSVYKTNAVRSSFQIRGDHEQGEVTATFTHKKNNFGWKERDFSLKVVFGIGKTTVERLEAPVPNPDREPSKKEKVFEAVEELGRATAEMVARATGISLQTVRNSISELLSEGALRDTGDKQGRSRIVVTHSHTTKGTGTGTKAQAATSSLDEDDSDSHPIGCSCLECSI
jgi:RecA-family ATPase